jgi:hypothetical protein
MLRLVAFAIARLTPSDTSKAMVPRDDFAPSRSRVVRRHHVATAIGAS